MHPYTKVGRRSFILRSASALLIPASLRSATPPRRDLLRVADAPDSVTVTSESGLTKLTRSGDAWQASGMELAIARQKDASAIALHAPAVPALRVHLRWELEPSGGLRYLGDDWERSYGTLSWRSMEPERIMPWYFLAAEGTSTFGCGVKTGAAALCFWQVDPAGVSLWLDVRNGGRGVQLGDRTIQLASIVAENYSGIKPFAAAQRFCHRMSPSPRLPPAPVYGGNNWYYAYGKSSAADIRDDSERISSWAGSNQNRPFMVIDDGWQPNSGAGPFSKGNARFPEMAALADSMRRVGVQPGIWIRPTFTKDDTPRDWGLKSPNAAKEYSSNGAFTLDPSVPEVMHRIQRDVRTVVDWGYTLVKHDFSTYDLLGRWGFNMGAEVTDARWNFADRSRTNAEVIRGLYQGLRDAAASAMLLGCNTIGHLAAGLFELDRTGDDTSGRDWNRTRKMGVNTLAFRAPQQGSFFAVDADCVGMTKQIPWNLNRQWLDLLARSGTPLFVSAAPDAVGPEQTAALKRAFAIAAKPGPVGEPLDWMRSAEPEEWILQGERTRFHWFEDEGASPFSG